MRASLQQCEKLLTPERNQLTEDIIEACECLKGWWKKELIQQRKDSGGSELCGSEVDSFNSRVSSKVIGNGNSNGNASTARAEFVDDRVRMTHFTATPGSAAPFPDPEIHPASYPRGPSPPSPMRA